MVAPSSTTQLYPIFHVQRDGLNTRTRRWIWEFPSLTYLLSSYYNFIRRFNKSTGSAISNSAIFSDTMYDEINLKRSSPKTSSLPSLVVIVYHTVLSFKCMHNDSSFNDYFNKIIYNHYIQGDEKDSIMLSFISVTSECKNNLGLLCSEIQL